MYVAMAEYAAIFIPYAIMCIIKALLLKSILRVPMYPLFATPHFPLLSNSCVRLGGNGGCLGKSVIVVWKQIKIKNYNYLQAIVAIPIGITAPDKIQFSTYSSFPISSILSWFFTTNGGRMKPTANPTWVPNTPRAQAVDTYWKFVLFFFTKPNCTPVTSYTCCAPNQTEAIFGGRLAITVWAADKITCPNIATQNRCGWTENNFTTVPRVVPSPPIKAAHRKP